MSIEFNDENQAVYAQMRQAQSAHSSKFAQFLIARKVVSTEDQANKVLLGIAFGAVILTIIVIYKFVL